MSLENMDDPVQQHFVHEDPVQDDPLLRAGAYIDPTPSPTLTPNPNPNPTSNGNGNGNENGNGKGVAADLAVAVATTTPPPPNKKGGSSGPIDATDPANRPDWLPAHWLFRETLRHSGATAGSKDKYFIDPATNNRFRSKKEVFRYLETGATPKQKRKADYEADKSDNNKLQRLSKSETPKRKKSDSKGKKSEAKAKHSMKNFNFDEVPDKVKWEMIDVYEGIWRPLINGVDRVPESSKQDWAAAFTYLTIQNGARTIV